MSIKQILKESLLQNVCEVDSNVGYSNEHMIYLNRFCQYCNKQLQLNQLPKIFIVSQRKNGMTTGSFNPSTNEIHVYGLKRALVDVMRTIAHELTHYKQRLENRITSNERDWDLESESDTKAGQLIYTFAHMNPDNMKIYEL